MIVILIKNTMGSTFKIVILASFQTPIKRGQTKQAQKKSYGNQEKEVAHDSVPIFGEIGWMGVILFLALVEIFGDFQWKFRRMEFAITMIEEADMAMAAKRGVTYPNIAKGTAIIL